MRTLMLLALGLVWCASVAHAEPTRIHGRAINARAVPVPDATVLLRAGAWRETVTTDERGRFDVAVPAGTVAATVTVTGELGETALIAVIRTNVNSEPLQVVMGPVGDATITLLENDTPVAGVRAQVLNGSSYRRYVISDVVSDAQGQFTVRLPHRQFTVSITDPRFARDGQDFQVPGSKNKPYQEWHPLRVNLLRPRSLVVRVTNADGSIPVGASVALSTSARGRGELFPNAPELKTNNNGEVRFERIPRKSFYVRAGIGVPRGHGVLQVSPDDEDVSIQLESLPVHTLRWPLIDSAHNPHDGAALRFRTIGRRAVDLPARISDGVVVLENYPKKGEYGYAVHDEQRAAYVVYDLERRLHQSEVVNQPTTFMPVVPFGFQLLGPDGAPLAHAKVQLRGKYLLRDDSGVLREGVYANRVLDDDGRLDAHGVFFTPLTIKLNPNEVLPGKTKPWSYDPQQAGDARPVFRVPASETREVLARITLDGQPGVPADLRVYYGGNIKPLTLDGERGTARFRVIPKSAESTYRSVSANGYVSANPTFDFSKPGLIEVDIDLQTELEILLVVDPEPAGYADEQFELHRFDPATQMWSYVNNADGGDSGVHRRYDLEQKGIACWRSLTGFGAGRYRIVHTPTGLIEGPFDIDASKPRWTVGFDYSAFRIVSGTVTGAPPEHLRAARVLEVDGVPGLTWIEGESTTERSPVSATGSFSVRAPTGQQTTYEVDHPFYEPARFVVNDKTVGDVSVTLVPRVCLTVPLLMPANTPAFFHSSNVFSFSGMRMARTRSLIAHRTDQWRGPPFLSIRSKIDDAFTWNVTRRKYDSEERTFVFPVGDAKQVVFFLDVPTAAPALITADVPKGGGTIKTVALARGSQLHIRFPENPRNRIKWAYAVATPNTKPGAPTYERKAREQDDVRDADLVTGLTVPGLAKGTFEVTLTVHREHGGAAKLERTFEVDGRSDQTWQVKLP